MNRRSELWLNLVVLLCVFFSVSIASASVIPHREQGYLEGANIVAEVSTNISSSLTPETGKQNSDENIVQENCVDLRDECAKWKGEGSCEEHAMYMTYHCARTCNFCHMRTDQRQVPVEEAWSEPKKKLAASVVSDGFGSDLGILQSVPFGENNFHDRIRKHVEQQRHYLKNTIQRDDRYSAVKDSCRNYDHECTYFALLGECEKNPDFMVSSCPLACYSCHELDAQARCFVDRNTKNALYPGDLNDMFERIVNDQNVLSAYNVTILSQPGKVKFTDSSASGKKVLVDRGPWVIQLDNFFGEDEANRLLGIGDELGFSRSTVLRENGAGDSHISDYRTSETAWCDRSCSQDPVVASLFQRVENLTGVSRKNSENLQLLHYGVGGYYKSHNDYLNGYENKVHGVRILTVFLYLNDSGDPPLEGGGTHFPKLGLTVQPKRGRAVIWPSVLNNDPHRIDPRTLHESLEVTSGQKYGANMWLHQREFRAECE